LGPFVPNPKGATRTVELEEFLKMLRFDNRPKLGELGIDVTQEFQATYSVFNEEHKNY